MAEDPAPARFFWPMCAAWRAGLTWRVAQGAMTEDEAGHEIRTESGSIRDRLARSVSRLGRSDAASACAAQDYREMARAVRLGRTHPDPCGRWRA
jgi:hypothetical protein